MASPSPNEFSWVQFDRFVRAGVPHAIEIAQALANSSLTVPKSPCFDLLAADLLYYGPIHTAYRRGVLGRLLTVLESLRNHQSWEVLRTSRSAQLTIIEAFLQTTLTNDAECVELLALWMSTHEAAPTVPSPSSICLFERESEIRRAA